MTKKFKRRVVLDGVSYIVEQDHTRNSLVIYFKENKGMLYAYNGGNIHYHYGYDALVKKIFELARVERYPIPNKVGDGS